MIKISWEIRSACRYTKSEKVHLPAVPSLTADRAECLGKSLSSGKHTVVFPLVLAAQRFPELGIVSLCFLALKGFFFC